MSHANPEALEQVTEDSRALLPIHLLTHMHMKVDPAQLLSDIGISSSVSLKGSKRHRTYSKWCSGTGSSQLLGNPSCVSLPNSMHIDVKVVSFKLAMENHLHSRNRQMLHIRAFVSSVNTC